MAEERVCERLCTLVGFCELKEKQLPDQMDPEVPKQLDMDTAVPKQLDTDTEVPKQLDTDTAAAAAEWAAAAAFAAAAAAEAEVRFAPAPPGSFPPPLWFTECVRTGGSHGVRTGGGVTTGMA